MRFDGKVVVVTGGASGIGRETATLFAEEGASVVVGDVDSAGGSEVVEAIKEQGGTAAFVWADVSSSAGARGLFDETIRRFDRLDILFNNAGIEISGKLVDFSEADFDRLVTTNLRSVFLCSKFALPHMIEKKSGVIVNAASVASFVAWPNNAVYNATKAGVLLLTKSIAVEYADCSIRANCIAPAIIDTPMTDRAVVQEPDKKWAKKEKGLLHPLGRLGTPREVAKVVLFLSSDEASFITGAAVPVDGGYTAR